MHLMTSSTAPPPAAESQPLADEARAGTVGSASVCFIWRMNGFSGRDSLGSRRPSRLLDLPVHAQAKECYDDQDCHATDDESPSSCGHIFSPSRQPVSLDFPDWSCDLASRILFHTMLHATHQQSRRKPQTAATSTDPKPTATTIKPGDRWQVKECLVLGGAGAGGVARALALDRRAWRGDNGR
jgi:hypothetical protein